MGATADSTVWVPAWLCMRLPACPHPRPCEQGGALLVGLITTLRVREAVSKGRLGSAGPGQHSTSIRCSQQEAVMSFIPHPFLYYSARLFLVFSVPGRTVVGKHGASLPRRRRRVLGKRTRRCGFFCQQHTGASPRSSQWSVLKKKIHFTAKYIHS